MTAFSTSTDRVITSSTANGDRLVGQDDVWGEWAQPATSNSASDRRLESLVRSFFFAHPDRRTAIAQSIGNIIAESPTTIETVVQMLQLASRVRAHDRVALTADMLILSGADVTRLGVSIVNPISDGSVAIDDDGRLSLMKALARRADPASLTIIEFALKSRSEEVREAAVEALAIIGDKHAMHLLTHTINHDSSSSVRLLAAECLSQLVD